MIGDKLVITPYHREGARQIYEHVRERLAAGQLPLSVSISGESGSGKTEMAHCLAELLHRDDRRWVTLAQDDYFRLPPRSNHEKRLEDIDWVGPGEVHLDLMAAHVAALKEGTSQPLEKPQVHFEENLIGTEVLDEGPYDVIVAEGTYTGRLDGIDLRAFIDRDYRQTKKARLKRARDPDVDFLERVLAIEHEVIRTQKATADVVIEAPPEDR